MRALWSVSLGHWNSPGTSRIGQTIRWGIQHQKLFPLCDSTITDRAAYLNYKQHQKPLVYWITRAWKNIINTSPSEAPVISVSTRGVSLATPNALSQFITRHNKRIPTILYQLFWSIIVARRGRHLLFLTIAVSNWTIRIWRLYHVTVQKSRNDILSKVLLHRIFEI